LVYLP